MWLVVLCFLEIDAKKMFDEMLEPLHCFRTCDFLPRIMMVMLLNVAVGTVDLLHGLSGSMSRYYLLLWNVSNFSSIHFFWLKFKVALVLK